MSRENPKEVVVQLKPGDKGVVTQTVPKMIELGMRDAKDPFIIKIAKGKEGATDVETVENIYNWVWKTFPYEKDPDDAEYVTAPIHLVNFNYEHCDCDDMTTLLIALLDSLGFRMYIKTIAWDKKRCTKNDCPFTHVYLVVEIPSLDGYVALDAVQKSKGFGRENPPTPIIRHLYHQVN